MPVDDYAWFADDLALGLNLCLTFVRGLGPDETLDRLDGTSPVEIKSARHLEQAATVVFDLRDSNVHLSLAAAAAVGAWTMLIEPNHFLATLPSVIQALSEHGELVSFYYNENTTPRFTWARNGQVVVTFIPTDPAELTSIDPNPLAEEMARLGFDAAADGEDDLFQERTLALMEHLTGVRLTPELLDTTVFRCSAVPYPEGPRPPRGTLTAAGLALTRFAADPDRDELLDLLWDENGVTDKRLRASGHIGVLVFVNSNNAFRFLAACDDTQLREAIRWGRERIFAEAGLTGRPWLQPLREALLRGEPIPTADRETAVQNLDPDPSFPPVDHSGRLLRSERQHTAMRLLDPPASGNPLAVACHVVAILKDILDGGPTRMIQELRRALPGVRDA